MERKSTQGFTLIELLLAVAIAGILLSVGVPSFSNAIKESRISSQYNAMVGSLYLARSEAVKGSTNVTVCPRKTTGAEECGGKNNWNNGWLVFVDRTTLQGEASAKIDVDDEIIAMEPGLRGDNTLMAIGSPTNSAANSDEVAYIRYTQSGGAQWSSGSVIVCDAERGASHSRAINIVLTGDIRRGRSQGDEEVPRDVFNQPISKYCSES